MQIASGVDQVAKNESWLAVPARDASKVTFRCSGPAAETGIHAEGSNLARVDHHGRLAGDAAAPERGHGLYGDHLRLRAAGKGGRASRRRGRRPLGG
ncbi:hypothetical protein [Streptomyces sp. NWU49]|uniref:hypothetical protein n=1 Tax=Streptomyces sp. NWU49 TaxID=2201153 RepID=UPI0011B722C8|nr:hypothetical protein [Streptomyces sp. NWU49]